MSSGFIDFEDLQAQAFSHYQSDAHEFKQRENVPIVKIYNYNIRDNHFFKGNCFWM